MAKRLTKREKERETRIGEESWMEETLLIRGLLFGMLSQERRVKSFAERRARKLLCLPAPKKGKKR